MKRDFFIVCVILLTALFVVQTVSADSIFEVYRTSDASSEKGSIITAPRLSARVGEWICYVVDPKNVKKEDVFLLLEPYTNDGSAWDSDKVYDPSWMVTAIDDGQEIRLCFLVSEANTFDLTARAFRQGELMDSRTDTIYPVPLGTINTEVSPINSDSSLEVGRDYSIQVDVFLEPNIGPDETRYFTLSTRPFLQGGCTLQGFDTPASFQGNEYHETFPFDGETIPCTGSMKYRVSIVTHDNDGLKIEPVTTVYTLPIHDSTQVVEGHRVVYVPFVLLN